MESKGVAAWKPETRKRHISTALQAYAAMTTSASRGAVRDLTQLQRLAPGDGDAASQRRTLHLKVPS